MNKTTERGVMCLGEKFSVSFSLLQMAFGFAVGLGYCDFDIPALLAMYEGFLDSNVGYLAVMEGVFLASFVSVMGAEVGLLVDWLLPKLRRKK